LGEGEWYLITLILTFSLEGEGGENRKKMIYEMTSRHFYFLGAATGAAGTASEAALIPARPFSKSPPTILSMSMNI